MNIQLITNAYPTKASSYNGAFAREFALKLLSLGHKVVINAPAKEQLYQHEKNLPLILFPWESQEKALQAVNLLNPFNWKFIINYFKTAKNIAIKTAKEYHINHVFCFWIIPSGLFGLAIKNKLNIPYDLWALGSDIWKVKKIPFIGKYLLSKIITKADRVFADGYHLCQQVKTISNINCHYLPTARRLPSSRPFKTVERHHKITSLLFVGRYEHVKGPDILIKSISYLSENIKKNIHLHMFGEGKMKKRLKYLIIKFKVTKLITLHGPIHRQQLSNYFKRTRFLIIPSRNESIPVVFSDALQKRVPVIATPSGDLPRLINQYHCGILAGDFKPYSLAQAIEAGLKLRKEIFYQGIKKAYRKFDINQAVIAWQKNITS